MTARPYTDDDLLTEAAVHREALSTRPTVEDIVRSMTGAYVKSRRTETDRPTWKEVLADPEELDTAARRVHDLINGAADCSAWAVKLGADGLEPEDHTLQLGVDPGNGDRPWVRMHFAFSPEIDPDARDRFLMELSKVIAREL